MESEWKPWMKSRERKVREAYSQQFAGLIWIAIAATLLLIIILGSSIAERSRIETMKATSAEATMKANGITQ